MREPDWNDYPDFGKYVEDFDRWKRAETYGTSDIRGPDDARRRIDARFADLDSIEWPGRTQQARENERRLVEAIMLDMYDRSNIYAFPSKRYLSELTGMAASHVYRIFQRVMRVPGLFRWVKSPEYRKQGRIRLRVGEAGPDPKGRSDAEGADAANRAYDQGPDVGPEVGLRSGSLRTLEPDPYPSPNVVHKGGIQISTSAEVDRASNFFTAPVSFAASGGSENAGPEEPLQLGDENHTLALTPPLVTDEPDERAWTVELTPEPESSTSDDEFTAEDIANAERMFGSCDEYSLSYVRDHRLEETP